jgi:hypothetical protein
MLFHGVQRRVLFHISSVPLLSLSFPFCAHGVGKNLQISGSLIDNLAAINIRLEHIIVHCRSSFSSIAQKVAENKKEWDEKS